jgi:ATP-binding cassette subfamily B protein
MPLAYGAVVDHLYGGRLDYSAFFWLVGAYALARLVQDLFTELKMTVFTQVAQQAVSRLALDAFRRLLALPLSFHLDRKTGELSKAVDRAARGVDYLLSLTMFEILPIALELFLAAGVLWAGFGLRYALLTTGVVAAYVALTFLLTEWRVRYRSRLNEAEEHAAGYALDTLINYETVKCFNAEAQAEANYGRLLDRSRQATLRWRYSMSLVNLVQGLLITLGVYATMLVAGRDIAGGSMSAGGFVAVNAYLLQLYLPLGFLGHVYREIRGSLADIGRLFGVLEAPGGLAEKGPKARLAVSAGELEFDKVSFAYGDRQVLREVSFRVAPGRKVGVVGPSGSGKTTLTRLLLRLCRPDAGVIRIDGRDTAEVSAESVREAVGVVPQDAALFNVTLGENITLGRALDAPGELERAARTARLETLAQELPDGYATRVGERGLKLSGGERQRVAIARAVLKAPPILILDEATSSLDAETEQELLEALRLASRSRTTLAIAHRLSAVVDADEILFLDAGRIVESGTHRELLRRNGRYAAMWRSQQAQATPPQDGKVGA